MSERIAVGDLVQIVRWPCCGRYLGEIHGVRGFGQLSATYACNGCCAKRAVVPAALIGDAKSSGLVPLAWLKRIPPLSELEGVRTEEPIKETA